MAIVTGNSSDNTLRGTSYNDTILGYGGDDTLIGGLGDDDLYGGDGIDTADYSHWDTLAVGQTVYFDLSPELGGTAVRLDDPRIPDPTAIRPSLEVIEWDELYSIENIRGTNVDDVFFGSAFGLVNVDNEFWGRGGNDTFHGDLGRDTYHGGSGNDEVDYSNSSGVVVDLVNGLGLGSLAEGDTYTSIENVTGSNYADIIYGNNGSNVLNGLGGDDEIYGGAGGDTMDGGDGVDTLSYYDPASGVTVNLLTNTASGGDAEGDVIRNFENVTGTNSSDTLTGSHGDNSFWGFGGNDYLFGLGGADTLLGGAGNDTLDGGRGNDTMIGGSDNDTYYVDSAGDGIIERSGQGADTAFSSALGYTLSAHIETLSLDTASDAGVYGTGNAQSNTIFGNANHNVLEGGGGADQLNGLGGNDNFVFRPGDANGDTVYEFAGNGAAVGDFMYFIGYGSAADGASFVQLTASTWQINSADGQTHDVITLAGAPTIDPGDFVFI